VVICLQQSANDLHMDGPADATATPSSLVSLKCRMVPPFWYLLTQVVLVKKETVKYV